MVAGEPLQTSGTAMRSEALAIQVGLSDDTRTLWLGAGSGKRWLGSPAEVRGLLLQSGV